MKKSKLLNLFIVAISTFSLFACGKNKDIDYKVDISMNNNILPDTVEVYIGDKLYLTPYISPYMKAKNIQYTWISSNEDVINRVDDHFEAVGVGETTIKLSVNGYERSIDFTVNPYLMTSFSYTCHHNSFSPAYVDEGCAETTVSLNKLISLSIDYTPENATDNTFIVTSSNSNVLSCEKFDETWELYSKAPGNATITITSNGITKTIDYVVKEKVESSGITILKKEINVDVDDKSSNSLYSYISKNGLYATSIEPFTYEIANTDIAEIYDHYIKPKDVGNTVINFYNGDDFVDSINLYVTQVMVTSFFVSPTNVLENYWDTAELEVALVEPRNGTISNIVWEVRPEDSEYIRIEEIGKKVMVRLIKDPGEFKMAYVYATANKGLGYRAGVPIYIR